MLLQGAGHSTEPFLTPQFADTIRGSIQVGLDERNTNTFKSVSAFPVGHKLRHLWRFNQFSTSNMRTGYSCAKLRSLHLLSPRERVQHATNQAQLGLHFVTTRKVDSNPGVVDCPTSKILGLSLPWGSPKKRNSVKTWAKLPNLAPPPPPRLQLFPHRCPMRQGEGKMEPFGCGESAVRHWHGKLGGTPEIGKMAKQCINNMPFGSTLSCSWTKFASNLHQL